MSSFIEKIDKSNLPKHIAIIMDGNGRWAKERGYDRIFGHQNGVTSVRETTEAAAEIGIQYLTLYAFSTENWSRPQLEVDALMELLIDTIEKETPTLNKNNVRLLTIGDLSRLPGNAGEKLHRCILQTAKNTGFITCFSFELFVTLGNNQCLKGNMQRCPGRKIKRRKHQ